MKILFSCGGTGGHINPAIAIADTIKQKIPQTEVLCVGAEKGMEGTLVPKAGYDIKFVKVRGFKRKLSLSNIDAAIKAITSVSAAKKIIKEFKPDQNWSYLPLSMSRTLIQVLLQGACPTMQTRFA